MRIRGAVDTNAMYLAVEVSKEKRGWTQNRLGKGQFNMDSVELFFRTRVREVDWLDPAYRNGDIKLSLAQDSEHPEQKHISVDRGDAFVSTNGIAFAFSDMAVGPGSVCEIRIPWTALTDFQDGKPDFLGFDMSINLSEDGNTRTHQYTWSGTGDNWRDTRRFGILKVQ